MKSMNLLIGLLLLSLIGYGQKETKSRLVIKKFESPKSGESADIFEASKNGNLEDVKKFIADRVDVNAKNDDDETALMKATWWGQF